MNSTTQNIVQFFLFSLAFGTQIFSPVVSTKLTGVGFYKLGTSIVLVSLLMAFGVDYSMTPEMSGCEKALYIGLIASNLVTHIFHRDQKNWVMWTFYGLQILGFSSLGFMIFGSTDIGLIFFMSSMLLLGISNFSMILGHYYLVVPKLTEQPLLISLYLFWFAMFLKISLSLAVLKNHGLPFLVEGSTVGDGYTFNWLFIVMRGLWGYLTPLILSFFTFRLCAMRSIQSATGVFYIIEFFVIVGELISAYLFFKHGLAI